MDQQTYEAPRLDRLGSLEALTAGNASADTNDTTHPNSPPFFDGSNVP